MTDDRIVRMLRVSESDPVQQEAADEIERLIAELATEKEVSASRQKLIFAGLAERDGTRAELAGAREVLREIRCGWVLNAELNFRIDAFINKGETDGQG